MAVIKKEKNSSLDRKLMSDLFFMFLTIKEFQNEKVAFRDFKVDI